MKPSRVGRRVLQISARMAKGSRERLERGTETVEREAQSSHRNHQLTRPEYRSAIFTNTPEQEAIAKQVTAEVQDK